MSVGVSYVYWDQSGNNPAPTGPVMFTDGIYCLTKSVAWAAGNLRRMMPDGTLIDMIPASPGVYIAPLYLPAGAYVLAGTAATVGEIARIAIRVH